MASSFPSFKLPWTPTSVPLPGNGPMSSVDCFWNFYFNKVSMPQRVATESRQLDRCSQQLLSVRVVSFVGLLADPRYCGVSYVEKEEVRTLLRKDPEFWARRPLSEMMKRAAADDVRFLLHIHHKMIEKLNEHSIWQLAVRGSLYCRCFCVNDNDHKDWPPVPPLPDNLITEGKMLEEEILSVVHVPSGKMGRVIGRKGASILSIKQSCKAEIFIGGAKGPPDKIFVIGALKEVRKAEAILRGKIL